MLSNEKIKIYHVQGGSLDDVDFFFAENGELLASWQRGDAQWRAEYMNPLLAKLGFEAVTVPAWKFQTQINTALGVEQKVLKCPYANCNEVFKTDGDRFEHEKQHKRKKVEPTRG